MTNQETPGTPAKRKQGCLLAVLISLVIFLLFCIHTITWRDAEIKHHRKMRIAVLKANLHQLRNGIDQFKFDTGVYPAILLDLTRAQADAPTTGVNAQGDTVLIIAGAYKGPYFCSTAGIGDTGIPNNPLESLQDIDYLNVNTHWEYQNGVVHPAGSKEGKTLEGIPYSVF